MIQSTLTNFNYIRPEWKQNCEEERLLGVDITGQLDCPWFKPETRDDFYLQLQCEVAMMAEEYSQLLGVNYPAALTCVKPSGNSSQFLNTSSGIHPRYAPYYVRRIRIAASNPVSQFLGSRGVPHFPEVGDNPTNPMIWVFEFPVKSPDGAITRNDVTALQMLEQWKSCKINYTEHNPSCTIYVGEDEWWPVGAWVFRNWDVIGGLSFLPRSGGVYQLAPYSECTKEEYERRMAEWPMLDWTELKYHETTDQTDVAREFACQSGQCEL